MGFGEPQKFGGDTEQKKTNFIQIGGIWERDNKLSGQLKLQIPGQGEVKYNFRITKNKFKTNAKQPSYHLIVDGDKHPELRAETETEEDLLTPQTAAAPA